MAIREILIYPDDHLREVAKIVDDPTSDEIRSLVKDMADTMYHAPGVGLAAPQLGVNLRVAITDTDWRSGRYDDADEGKPIEPKRDLKVWINPKFIWKSDDLLSNEEGCLSVPDVYEDVTRPAAVTLRWQDMEGMQHEADFDGFLAVALQHEFDHLDGKLFIDYLSPLKRKMITKRLKKRYK